MPGCRFQSGLRRTPVQREPTAFQWINTIGNDCSYEQLEAIKNNLGSWLGTANSPRVSTALARQLEAYYVAKNEWNEDLYTSRAAFVAPYDAGTKTAQTNTIIPPNYQNLYQFGQPQNQFGQPFNQGFQQPSIRFSFLGQAFKTNRTQISFRISMVQIRIQEITLTQIQIGELRSLQINSEIKNKESNVSGRSKF